MNRKARELAQRQRATVTVVRQRSWGPEVAGFCLLVAAILSSAGMLS